MRLSAVPAPTTADERTMCASVASCTSLMFPRGLPAVARQSCRCARSRGSRGWASRLLHALTERFEIAHEPVDVVGQGAQFRDVSRIHRQLDGAGGRFVETGVDQTKLVLCFADRLVHPLRRAELRLQRLDGLLERAALGRRAR